MRNDAEGAAAWAAVARSVPSVGVLVKCIVVRSNNCSVVRGVISLCKNTVVK